MPRFGLTLPDDMELALKKESDKTGAPLSALVRMALEEFLEKRGYKVGSSLKWGGYRDRRSKRRKADRED